MSNVSELTNYEQYCRAFQGNDEEKQLAGLLFLLRSHMLRIQALDTAEAGFVTTDDIIFHYPEKTDHPGDYISYPARKMARVFRHIVEHMRTNILHENVMMPIYKANEFNSQSIGWLSRRPGRNIHEKLAGTRSIMAVHRRMTTDTSENRLFKTMARRLEDALFDKKDKLPESYQDDEEEFLYESLRRFRTLPEAEEILPWRNLPPNNTLLSDKNYNVVWRAWNDLENIGQQIREDCKHLDQRLAGIALILLIHKLGRYFRFPQQPICYKYDTFEIKPVFQTIQAIQGVGIAARVLQIKFVPEKAKIVLNYQGSEGTLTFSGRQIQFIKGKKRMTARATAGEFLQQIDDIIGELLEDAKTVQALTTAKQLTGTSAVVDLFRFRPSILHEGAVSLFPGQLLYQELQQDEKPLLFSCCESQAVLDFRSKGVASYTIRKLVAEDEDSGMSYLNHLLDGVYRHVHTQQLDFIFPDSCNEFQLSHLKRVAKMHYRQVTALPKSLAAIFTFVHDARFQQKFRAGDTVMVLDRENDGTSITLIRSLHDKLVQKDIPELRSIVWEHHPAAFYPDDEEDTESGILQVVDRDDVIEADTHLCYWQPDGTWQQGGNTIPAAPMRRSLTGIIEDYKRKHQRLIGAGRVWVIAIAAMQEHLSAAYPQVDYSHKSILNGVCRYQELRQRTAYPLWRDCLPDLAIKRLYGKLDLVKNTTFEYGETLTMDIPIESGFTLPKGQEEYHFQLDMANAGTKVPYQAIVRHDVFPLDHDVECRLKMRYIYGNDNPYSLKFIPRDQESAGFHEAEVMWQRMDTFPSRNLKYPGFPPKNDWDYLRVYPNRDTSGTRDLLNGVIEAIGRVVRNWDYMPISDLDMRKTANWTLFCLHTIYFNGRHADDRDCPANVRKRLKSELDDLYEIYSELDPDGQDASWLFSMLCIAGRDVNECFATDVVERIQACADRPGKLRKEVGFMLGDFTLPYQQRIAKALDDELPAYFVPLLLAKAAWRNERFIYNFPVQSTLYYFQQAVQDVLAYGGDTKKKHGNDWDLQLRLEFIMAVFRLRQLEDEEIDNTLSMNNPLMRKLYRKVEELIKSGFRKKSRIQLEVRQGEEYRRYHIPDFMYALLVYITGDAGDSDIVISSIDES